MKKILAIFIMLFTGISLYSQDIIVKRDGTTINAKVLAIGTSVIEYKKWNNQDGPTYSIEKSEILAINYKNGDKDTFNNTDRVDNSNDSKQQATNTPNRALPDDDNEGQKALYSDLPNLNVKVSNKESKVFFPIMAFTESSVISTKELTIIIEPNTVQYYDGGWKTKIGYAIQIVNKTDVPIYIDRARCFKRYNDCETKNYFDNKQYTVTNGNISGLGASVGFGPIGIGTTHSSVSSNTETYGVERILAIGPHSKANLIDYKYIRLSESKAKFKTVSDIEYWGFNLSSNNKVHQGEVRTYSEADSPYSNKYLITYSTDSNFENYSTTEFELYAKYIVGAEIKSWKWTALSPLGIVAEIQKTVPCFWTKCMSIIGMNGYYQ